MGWDRNPKPTVVAAPTPVLVAHVMFVCQEKEGEREGGRGQLCVCVSIRVYVMFIERHWTIELLFMQLMNSFIQRFWEILDCV